MLCIQLRSHSSSKNEVWRNLFGQKEAPNAFLNNNNSDSDSDAFSEVLDKHINDQVNLTIKNVDKRLASQLNIPIQIDENELKTKLSNVIGKNPMGLNPDQNSEPRGYINTDDHDHEDLPKNSRRKRILDTVKENQNAFSYFKTEKAMKKILLKSQNNQLRNYHDSNNDERILRAKQRIELENKVDKQRRELKKMARKESNEDPSDNSNQKYITNENISNIPSGEVSIEILQSIQRAQFFKNVTRSFAVHLKGNLVKDLDQTFAHKLRERLENLVLSEDNPNKE